MIKKWTRRHYMLLSAILLLSLLMYFIGYLYLLKPLTIEIKTNAKQADMYEKQLWQLAENIKQTEDVTDITEKIPEKRALDQVLKALHDKATQTNVTVYWIESLSTTEEDTSQPKEESSIVTEEKFTLEVTAPDRQNILTFLNAIEIIHPLMIVNELEIVDHKDDLTATITFTTYYQAQKRES